MTHRSHLCTIVIDVPESDHTSTTSFWGAATGREQRELPEPEFHGARLHESLVLLVQRLGDGAARVHVDIHTDDVDAEVERLRKLGAELIEPYDDWTIMSDPAGLPFCVVKAPEGSLNGPDVKEWP